MNVPSEKLAEETMELANQLANGPGVALRLDKWATYAGLNMDLGSALFFASLRACEKIGPPLSGRRVGLNVEHRKLHKLSE